MTGIARALSRYRFRVQQGLSRNQFGVLNPNLNFVI
jgi:hypothetical protein